MRDRQRTRTLTIRWVLGPAAIVAAFFFFDRGSFSEVWKPLLTYFGFAVPVFFLMDRIARRRGRSPGLSRPDGHGQAHGASPPLATPTTDNP